MKQGLISAFKEVTDEILLGKKEQEKEQILDQNDFQEIIQSVQENYINLSDNQIHDLNKIWDENLKFHGGRPSIVGVYTGLCNKKSVGASEGLDETLSVATLITESLFNELIIPFFIKHNIQPYSDNYKTLGKLMLVIDDDYTPDKDENFNIQNALQSYEATNQLP